MKLKDIQKLFIKEGIEVDPRGVGIVELSLLKRIEKYEKLSSKERENYDVESLENPYYDSRILYGDKNTEVKNVMVGIDIESQEILIAKNLINSGTKIDLIIAHHPEGYAYSTFYGVLEMHIDILNKQGIPINIAERIVSEKMKEVQKNTIALNNERVYDAAKLLNIPLMTVHTVADNHVVAFLQREIDASNPVCLKEIIELLSKYPEYKHAAKIGYAPFILNGNKYSKCGKIFIDMTGGTNESIGSFERLEAAGIGTIVMMHLDSEGIKKAKERNLNIVLTGHISSNNLGLNLLLDKLEDKNFKFIECSGFRRFKRKNEYI
jgi:hypothetical protein